MAASGTPTGLSAALPGHELSPTSRTAPASAGIAGREHGPDNLAHGPRLGAAPLVAQRVHHVQPAARLAEPAGVLRYRDLVTGIGDCAQYPRPRLQQAEPDRPARPYRPRAGHRVAQGVGQQFGDHADDVPAALADAPAPQRGAGEVPGGPDRLGTGSRRAGGHLRVAGPALRAG